MSGMRRVVMRTLLVGVVLAAWSTPGVAQADVARGDSLLRDGQVARAERVYFAAARRRPRDPEARFALGSYLASRGAWRVGGVLIEEARRFGGSAARAAALLAPIYAETGAYAALLALGDLRLPAGEIARARHLRSNPQSFAGPDSIRLPLLGAADARSLGAIRILVGSDTVIAELDPSVRGLIVDRAHIRTPGVRTFDARPDGTRPAAASRISLMRMTLRNAPLELGDTGGAGHARMGFDWLARWAPTVDLRGRSVTLRRSGRVPANVSNARTERLAMLYWTPGPSGTRLEGPWVPAYRGYTRLGTDVLLRMRPLRVTYDPRRGDLMLDR